MLSLMIVGIEAKPSPRRLRLVGQCPSRRGVCVGGAALRAIKQFDSEFREREISRRVREYCGERTRDYD